MTNSSKQKICWAEIRILMDTCILFIEKYLYLGPLANTYTVLQLALYIDDILKWHTNLDNFKWKQKTQTETENCLTP